MRGNKDKPVAVILGVGDPNGYGLIRGLAKRGIPVIGLDTRRRALGLFSRYCKGMVCPDPKRSGEEEFIDFLIRLGEKMHTKGVLFPFREDLQVVALAHRDRLERYYRFPIARLEIVEKILDKEKFYRALEGTDIPYPKTYFPNDISEVERISKEIAYPCIIKPTKSMDFGKEFGVKLFKADSDKELVDAYVRATASGYRVVIQEIIPGGDTELYTFFGYFDRDSNLIAAFTLVKVRQYPHGFGVTALGKSVWEPKVVELGTQFLQKIRYHGIVDAEFKRDPRDGRFMFLEVNARTGIQNRLAARCGVNLPHIAYMDAIGESVSEVMPNGKEVKWVSEVHDLMSSLQSMLKRELTLREWIGSLRGEKEYAHFAWDDPIPFFVLLLNLVPDGLRAFLLRPLRLYFRRKSLNRSHQNS